MPVLFAVTDPAQVRHVLDHLAKRTRQRVPSRAWARMPVDDIGKSTTGDDRDLPFGDWN